eukprot:2143182-Rhodomonas_salina.1
MAGARALDWEWSNRFSVHMQQRIAAALGVCGGYLRGASALPAACEASATTLRRQRITTAQNITPPDMHIAGSKHVSTSPRCKDAA